MFVKYIQADRRVLAVDMEHLFAVLTNMRTPINQLGHLMTGFPLEPNILSRDFIEHEFPGIGIDSDVPIALAPVASHRAIFEGDFKAVVGGTFGQIAKNLPIPGHGFREGLVNDTTGETSDDSGSEMMGIVDQLSPCLAGELVLLRISKWIAKNSQRINARARVRKVFFQLCGQFW